MDAQRLRTIPLFSGLSKRQLEQLAGWIDEVDLPAGKQLLGEGTLAYEFVMIESGSASVSIDGQHVNDLGAGDFFGEIALLDGGPRTATATAETACRLLSMTYQMFHDLLDASPSIRSAILEAVGQRLRELEPGSPV